MADFFFVRDKARSLSFVFCKIRANLFASSCRPALFFLVYSFTRVDTLDKGQNNIAKKQV